MSMAYRYDSESSMVRAVEGFDEWREPELSFNKTLLTFASAQQWPLAVLTLLQKGAKINRPDVNGDTALTAVSNSWKHDSKVKDILELLLQHGADVNHHCGTDTALTACARAGNLEAVDLLLDAGADVDVQGHRGTAFAQAFYHGRIQVARRLIERGADVNISSSFVTPFTEAPTKGEDFVNLMLDHGAQVNQANRHGYTALMTASSSRGSGAGMVKLLLRHGADVNQRTCFGNTALFQAWDMEVMTTLVDQGADVNVVGRGGSTPLTNAIHQGNLAALTYLLQAGAKITYEVHEAIRLNKKDFLEEMIRYGASPTVLSVEKVFQSNMRLRTFWFDLSELSPLRTALLLGNEDIASYLLNLWFLTPLDMACLPNDGFIKEKMKFFERCDTDRLFQAICRKPWSLLILSFVTVSALLGSGRVREEAVRNSGLPKLLQNKLLFLST